VRLLDRLGELAESISQPVESLPYRGGCCGQGVVVDRIAERIAKACLCELTRRMSLAYPGEGIACSVDRWLAGLIEGRLECTIGLAHIGVEVGAPGLHGHADDAGHLDGRRLDDRPRAVVI